jgi:TatD DNase family protein
MDYFSDDREEVYERAVSSGLSFIVTVGINLEDSKKAMEFARTHEIVYFTCGFHPHDASKMKREDLVKLEEVATNKKNVAIGEIGLDFYRNYSPRDVQIKAFEIQLDLADRLGKPLVLHVRDAHEEVISILKNFPNVKGIVHCFSGNKDHLREYLDMGFVVSFAGNLTYNRDLQEVIKFVPIDRLLFETDCPFLTPLSKRGKRNEPSFVLDVYEFGAVLIGVERKKLVERIFLNFLEAFYLTR